MNLSAFETFFAERRPFFVEGSGIFRFDVDCNDGQCSGPVLLAAHRPVSRAATRTCPTAGTRPAAGADDDPRRREADRARRRVLDRRAQRRHADEDALIAERLAAHAPDDRAADQLLRRPRAARVHEPVVARLHDDGDQPQPRRRDAVPARAGLHGRRGLGLAAQRRSTRSRDSGRAAPCAATPAAIDELQQQQRPQLPAAGLRPRSTTIPTRTSLERLRRATCRCRRSAASACASTPNVGIKSPGFDINDVGLPAPRRRADDQQLDAGALRQAVEVPAQLPLQPQSVGRLERRRRSAVARRQRQRARRVPEQLEHGLRRQRERAGVRRPRDARRARRVRQRRAQPVDLREHRRPQGRRRSASTRPTSTDGHGTHVRRLQPVRSRTGPSSFLSLERRAEPEPQHTTSRSGSSRDAAGPLRLRAHRPEHRRPDRARELHGHARRCRSSSTRSRSCRPATTRTFKELVDGRSKDYDDRYAPIAYARRPGLQLPVVPDDQRAAVGIQARARRCSSCGSRGARTRSTPATSASAATSAASSTRRRATSSSSSGRTGSITDDSRCHAAPGRRRQARRPRRHEDHDAAFGRNQNCGCAERGVGSQARARRTEKRSTPDSGMMWLPTTSSRRTGHGALRDTAPRPYRRDFNRI